MPYIGATLVLIGAYMLYSSVKNSPPIGTLKALLSDPSDLRGTLEKMRGSWVSWSGTKKPDLGSTTPATGGKTKDGVSGKLSDAELVTLSWDKSERLIPAAAAALEQLNVQYRARFGSNITVTDSYRSYDAQVSTKAAKGNLAATPGKSNHGWGTAVDLGGGIQNFGTTQYQWMLDNAPAFGWVAPSWARKGGSKPEPWHWEYGS